MGHERVLSFLQRVRDSFGRPGRPHRLAARVDQNRAVVVRIHVADRHGFQLRHAARRAFLLWDGRGRCVSQCIRGDRALDPSQTSRARLGHRLDDRSDWRCEHSAAGRAHPGTVRLAGVVLRVRCSGSAMERDLVRVVSRLAVGEAWRESAGAERNRTGVVVRSSAACRGSRRCAAPSSGKSPRLAPVTCIRSRSINRGCRRTW